MKPVFAMSGKGKNNNRVGRGVPDSCSDIPASCCRDSLALPDVNETEVVRHIHCPFNPELRRGQRHVPSGKLHHETQSQDK
jgi:hypothetical protein